MPLPLGPGGGGFGAIGGLIFAVSLLLTMRRQPPGPVGRLVKAGATSPTTALKPKTASIPRPSELAPSIRRGVVVELDDGRCWVDLPRLRRRRLALIAALGIGAAIVLELAWLFLRSVKGI
jgi:hypothetical protein